MIYELIDPDWLHDRVKLRHKGNHFPAGSAIGSIQAAKVVAQPAVSAAFGRVHMPQQAINRNVVVVPPTGFAAVQKMVAAVNAPILKLNHDLVRNR